MRAAKGGRFHIINYLVDKHGRIDLENKNNKTVMDYPAIRELILPRIKEKLRFHSSTGNLEMFMRYYFSKYIDINEIDDRMSQGDGLSYLMRAVDCGSSSLVKFLLEKGANLHQVCKYDESTVLMRAVSRGHELIVKQLLAKVVQLLATNTNQ